MEILLVLGLLLFGVVLVPIGLACLTVLLVLKLLAAILFFPLRLLFGLIGGVLLAFGFALKLVLGMALVVFLVLIGAGLILLPVFPLLLLALFGWVLYRLLRPARVPTAS